MIIKINPYKIPYDSLIQALCKLPFYGHSTGCPNYNKREGCPPGKTIEKIFDFNKEIYVIYTPFSVGEFAERMKVKHLDWKEKKYSQKIDKALELSKIIEDKLRKRNPDWPNEYYSKKIEETWTSAREWYNPRLWQPAARKKHREEIANFLSKNPHLIIERCPEARGVNLTGLMFELGIKLNWQWPPIHNKKNKVYLISLAGNSLKS